MLNSKKHGEASKEILVFNRRKRRRKHHAQTAPLSWSIQQIAQISLSTLDFDKVFDRLAEHVVSSGIFRDLEIFIPDGRTNTGEVVCAKARQLDRSWKEQTKANREISHPLGAIDILAETVRTGKLQTAIDPDETPHSGGSSNVKNEDIVSYYLPVKKDKKVLAVLSTTSTLLEKDETLRKINLMLPSLDYVAMALEHSLLYREAQEEITRRIAVEKKLQQSEKRLKLFFDNTNDLIALLNEDAETLWLNTAWLRTFSSDVEGLKDPFSRIHPDDREKADKVWNDFLVGNGEIVNVVFRFLHPDSRLFIFETSVYKVHQGSEKLYYLIARDITERTQTQEALRKSQEQLFQAQKLDSVGQLAGGVAHDFNNLLQVIHGYCELALDSVGPAGEARNDIEEVLDAAGRASSLVAQLLAFSRHQILELTDLDLNNVIQNMSEMIQSAVGEHIEIEIVLDKGAKTIRGDRGQLEQIVMNLCINARDAMPAGGHIAIKTVPASLNEEFSKSHKWAKAGDYMVLSVEDTGPGMNEETLEHIFEPFFTTKQFQEGTAGLGLSTVYGLVKQHQGMIHPRSKIGEGTVFSIYLPLVSSPAQTVEAEDSGEGPPAGKTILLAEDDASVRKFVKRVLEGAGYVVLAAGDGKEAIELYENRKDEVDLALLDVMMPKLGGKAVYENIVRLRPQVPTIFASGYSLNSIHTDFVLDEGLLLIHDFRALAVFRII